MQRKKLLLVLAASLLVAGLTGCATVKPGSPEALQKELNEQKQEQKTLAKQAIEEMPEWMSEPPQDSGVEVYAVGTGTSADLQLSADKAVQDAMGRLAHKIQSVVSAKTKRMLAESGVVGNATAVEEFQAVSTSLAANVNLAGYSVKKQKVVAQGTGFRTYVLVRYPLGEANRMLAQRIKNDAALSAKVIATEAYAELERDVQAAAKAASTPVAPAATPSTAAVTPPAAPAAAPAATK